ncbi:Zn-dependent protease [Aphanothece hegewaldii CCALA 016]|uniref:Zn-dependent protease n=1 Tax=Aphanothece hegewaldii CCALA 016 TaxID=2107694 RepID=A0A2T1LS04_9CHRO|nr:TldD/PmbA family protein [Aphanothece hegewaldii]PSF32105.1 Zn-dependent protease [Aphanothece hegewaldii CCALA 016]
MNLTTTEALESNFNQLSELLVNHLQSEEHLSIELSGEQSQFLRFNTAKVRQAGTVCDGTIQLTLINQQKTAYTAFPFTGDLAVDTAIALDKLNELKKEVAQLPEDPYIVLPENKGSSRDVYTGDLLPPSEAIDEILKDVQGLDFTGFYASGTVIRANANSAGQKHWFATESFFLDYSLIAPSEKAVKAILAGREWQASRYQEQIQQGIEQLKILNDTPVHEVKPGRYRTYLAPDATAAILGMFSWGGVSESSMRQGESALAKLREGKTLSPLFNLRENFTSGSVPRFNELGEIAPDEIPIIVEGKLVNTLVSSRTAIEYGLQANGASGSEGLRSPEISTGTLQNSEILKQLDTGLYLSNLHYLNWSDRPGGRMTGMTRYACFWVENGQIVAPIKDLRFDDSLYAFLGENLIALTDFQDMIPNTDTYFRRSLGGSLMPGLLLEDFTFTL